MMGSNDNDHDDGASPLRVSEEEYMTGGNDLLEFEQEHFDTLLEEFLNKHNNEWVKFVEEAYNNRGNE